VDDLLARAVLDEFGFGVAQFERGAEQFQGVAETGGWLGLHERGQFGCNVVDGPGAHAQSKAVPGAQGVDGDGKWTGLAVDGRVFDEQGLAAARRFHLAIGQLGDFEFGGEGRGNPSQLACPVEGGHPVTKGIECHSAVSVEGKRENGKARMEKAEDRTVTGFSMNREVLVRPAVAG